MRILVGGMSHESNSLNPIITGPNDFVVFRGAEILSHGMLPYYSSTGIINTLRDEGCQIVPTVVARAVPNGLISRPFYEGIKDEICAAIKTALGEGKIDGACLGLHGSMKVEGLGCAEGDLVAAMRELLPDIPFTAALDMHATITEKLLLGVNGFVGYKTAPHIDCAETGAQAASMLLQTLRTGKRLYTSWHSVPMIVAGEKSESEAEPMKTLMNRCRSMEKDPNVLAASILLGFPWADDADNCVATLVSTLDDAKKAEDLSTQLATEFWARRKDFNFKTENYFSKEAIQVAYDAVLKNGEKPVFVSDSGDNPTAGAAGDSTDMLECILKTIDVADSLPTPLLYSGFFDVVAVSACISAGVGATIDTLIGGTWDTLNGNRIPLRVKVLGIVRGFGPYHSDLVLVSHRNLRIVLTSKHIGFGDEELLPALGVEAKEYCLVVVKLGYLEPCFKTIAKRAIMALSRGCSNEALETIPYKKLRRPIYPLDPAMTFTVTQV